jgi:quercetin dioxygenase-like cupin family protein
MNVERFRELAALSAVTALEDADATEFQALCAQASPALQVELGEWAGLTGWLAAAQLPSVQPPEWVKAKLMDRVRSAAGARTAPREAGEVRADQPGFYTLLAQEGPWQALPVPGARMKQLAVDRRRGYTMMLLELAPGGHFPEHHHSGAEECFVISGDLHIQGRHLRAGDFHHAEAGSDHSQSYTENGCTILLVVAGEDYRA